MKVFYATGFQGHWPVGTSAVMVAKDRDEALYLLGVELAKHGLKPGDAYGDFEVVELDTSVANAVVLQDGEY